MPGGNWLNKKMNPLLFDFKQNAQKTFQLLQEDIKVIRTGRATPALIEDMIVDTYGGQTSLKLMELATITTEGPSALVIVPFDVSILQDIEKAILKSSMGLSPQVQGSRIVVKIPPLSQEQREKLLKFVNQKVEEKRVIIRNHRDETRRKIRQQLEKKEIAEDEKFRLEKEIDNLTQKFMEQIQEVKEVKEKEIMQV